MPCPRTRTAPVRPVAQPGEARLGRCRDLERRQGPHGSRDLAGALAGGQTQRAAEPDRDTGGAEVAAAPGQQQRVRSRVRSPGPSAEAVAVAGRAGGRLPRVAQQPAGAPAPAVGDGEPGPVGCPRPDRPTSARSTARAAGDGASSRSRPTSSATASTRATPCRSTGAARPAPPEEEQQRDPAGDRHRGDRSAGTGTEPRAEARTWATSAPRAPASGRRPSRCTSVAWARALTSSGSRSPPVSHAQARAERRSAVAPRGLTAQAGRRLPGRPRDVDDVPATSGLTCAADRLPAGGDVRSPATGSTPAARTSRGSKPAAWRRRISSSAARSGTGRTTFSRKRSSWASGSG